MKGTFTVVAVVVAAALVTCSSPDEIARKLAADPQLRAAVLLQLAHHLEHPEPQSNHQRELVESNSSYSGSSSSASGSEPGSASGSGSGTEYPPHSFFALTCEIGTYPGPLGHECTFLDWSWYGCWVVVIIAITIVLENVLNHLKHSSHGLLGFAIYEKILVELTMFGIVSLSLVTLANIPVLRTWLDMHSGFRLVMFELADVVLFVMALIHCTFLLILYRICRGVAARWGNLQQRSAAAVLERLEELVTSANERGRGQPGRKWSRSERNELAELILMAEFQCVCAQFKRQHMLTHVKKFNFVRYLRKALLSHMVPVINFSLRTWGCLAALHVLLILVDDGQVVAERNGYSRRDSGGEPWNFGPHPVSYGHQIFYLLLAWGFAMVQCVLWLCSRRQYLKTLARIYDPFAETWANFMRVKCPATFQLLRHMSVDRQRTMQMLYGFVSTNGEGPIGTTSEEAQGGIEQTCSAAIRSPAPSVAASPPPSPPEKDSVVDSSGSTGFTPRLDRCASGDPTGRASRGRMSSFMPKFVLQHKFNLSTMLNPSSGFLHRVTHPFGLEDSNADHSRQEHHQGGTAGYSGTSHWILKAMETNTAMMSYLCSFTLLFWIRESFHFPFAVSPQLLQKATNAGSGSLDNFSTGEATFVVLLTIIMIVLMLLPYAVFLGATVRVVRNFSIAHAVGHVDKDIMHVLESENEKAGDYVSAMMLLRNHLSRTVLPENASTAQVKEQIESKIKLGEFYWRYRAVLPGESPLTEAIRVLEEARQLCETRASELQPQQAELLFSLGCARLVHNQRRDEDPLIDQLLNTSLSLYMELEDHVGRAKVLNALGTLRMKAKRYGDAESHLRMMVDLRTRHLPRGDPDHGQGHMSLGSLLHEIGKLEEAAEQMKMALEAYIAAYHEMHPKVAWAHEGIAKVYMDKGELGLAREHINAAMAVRKEAQSKSDGHQLFAHQVSALEHQVRQLEITKAAKAKVLWKKGLGQKVSIGVAAAALRTSLSRQVTIESALAAPATSAADSDSMQDNSLEPAAQQPQPQQNSV